MLIEVMAALAILAIAGTALVAVAAESLQRLDLARRQERELARANNLLAAVSIWTREDLDRRLGSRPQGAWILEIERESPRLYAVSVRDTATRAVLLFTELYRVR